MIFFIKTQRDVSPSRCMAVPVFLGWGCTCVWWWWCVCVWWWGPGLASTRAHALFIVITNYHEVWVIHLNICSGLDVCQQLLYIGKLYLNIIPVARLFPLLPFRLFPCSSVPITNRALFYCFQTAHAHTSSHTLLPSHSSQFLIAVPPPVPP